MKKIVTVLGARPQFIKAAVLSRIIKSRSEIEEVIVHTGQHFDINMSQVFFEEMAIPTPKYNLEIHSMSHGAMTAKMLEEIEKILLIEKPEIVVVYGDTNSTLSGALAAKKLNIKVAHIESGLRSFNMNMPEEINRILTDRISNFLSCPTTNAVENLKREGFNSFPVSIVKHGDIMKDAVSFYSKDSEQKSSIIKDLNLKENQYVLATLHRQENTDNKAKLRSIFDALEEIDKQQKVVLPLHPRTKKMLQEYSINPRVNIIEPVGYFDMLELQKHCSLVITDSGGLQKEAFFNKKFCIIARDETEWKELVEFGFAKIVGSNKEAILNAFTYFNKQEKDFNRNLYGENVGEKIYMDLLTLLKK